MLKPASHLGFLAIWLGNAEVHNIVFPPMQNCSGQASFAYLVILSINTVFTMQMTVFKIVINNLQMGLIRVSQNILPHKLAFKHTGTVYYGPLKFVKKRVASWTDSKSVTIYNQKNILAELKTYVWHSAWIT